MLARKASATARWHGIACSLRLSRAADRPSGAACREILDLHLQRFDDTRKGVRVAIKARSRRSRKWWSESSRAIYAFRRPRAPASLPVLKTRLGPRTTAL